MPVQNFQPVKGRLETILVASEAIANNILGDPTTRQVMVYLPEGYDESIEEYPLLVDIAGFTGSGRRTVVGRRSQNRFRNEWIA